LANKPLKRTRAEEGAPQTKNTLSFFFPLSSFFFLPLPPGNATTGERER
jgi:hypothetical protein